MTLPLVSAIVSTYNAERFISGCLDDLLKQTIADQMEIIVIDSGSLENEAAMVEQYARRYPAIHLVRTGREGLYAAWNRGIRLARGKYLTNANTDDRHRPDAIEVLVDLLERAPDAALAYGNQVVSTTENETFEECIGLQGRRLQWPKFSPDGILLQCTVGPQPVWRRRVHDDYGYFNETYRIAGDGEFWIRLARHAPFIHTEELLGTFFDSPLTLSGSGNSFKRDIETMEIQLRFLNMTPWKDEKRVRHTLARELFGIGYRYVNARAPLQAKPFLRAACKLDPLNLRYLKTYILRATLKAGGK